MAGLNEEIGKYSHGWTDMMLQIWREQIERLRVIDTGALHESFSSQVASSAAGTSIKMKFLTYGLYVAAGTGRGYYRGNPGDLEFLDKDYRKKHKLGKARQAKDWFNKKYYRSYRVMVEDLARITGREAARVVANGLDGNPADLV
ncbi:MAG: hypothetical protein HDR74_06870 [Bacteroides sp.]|nr:hypothetical protein [Bacteroides sp.]